MEPTTNAPEMTLDELQRISLDLAHHAMGLFAERDRRRRPRRDGLPRRRSGSSSMAIHRLVAETLED